MSSINRALRDGQTIMSFKHCKINKRFLNCKTNFEILTKKQISFINKENPTGE